MNLKIPLHRFEFMEKNKKSKSCSVNILSEQKAKKKTGNKSTLLQNDIFLITYLRPKWQNPNRLCCLCLWWSVVQAAHQSIAFFCCFFLMFEINKHTFTHHSGNCKQVSLVFAPPLTFYNFVFFFCRLWAATQYYYILSIHFISDLITVIDGLRFYLIWVCRQLWICKIIMKI